MESVPGANTKERSTERVVENLTEDSVERRRCQKPGSNEPARKIGANGGREKNTRQRKARRCTAKHEKSTLS